jgi:hypothetical protein
MWANGAVSPWTGRRVVGESPTMKMNQCAKATPVEVEVCKGYCRGGCLRKELRVDKSCCAHRTNKRTGSVVQGSSQGRAEMRKRREILQAGACSYRSPDRTWGNCGTFLTSCTYDLIVHISNVVKGLGMPRKAR